MKTHMDLIEDAKPQLCVNCQYFKAEWPNAGRCRIRAKTHSGFPMVENEDWCGEWAMAFPNQSKETKPECPPIVDAE